MTSANDDFTTLNGCGYLYATLLVLLLIPVVVVLWSFAGHGVGWGLVLSLVLLWEIVAERHNGTGLFMRFRAFVQK
jgi:hypothetical protein